MRRRFILVSLVLLIIAPFNAANAKDLKIVAGTTLLSDILKDIAGSGAQIRTVIPGGSCPGHYDIKPGDIKLLAEADALFIHPWQKGQQNIQSIIRAAENEGLKIVMVAAKGNVMVPQVQCQAIEAISENLKRIDPGKAQAYTEAATRRISRVKRIDSELKEILKKEGVENRPVVCAAMQKGFVAWVGFNVIADYGRPEDLTPENLAQIISKARNSNVKLVVDNLQSGPDAGKGMAQELKAQQVNLSNFPNGFKGVDTWEKNIRKNIELLIKALGETE
jgi:zinc transport system substrate-binding protein